MDPGKLDVRHDPETSRFTCGLECGEGYVAYRRAGDALDLVSTWVPRQHRGFGIGERLVVTALEHARAEGLRVIPTCPFVPRVIERNPEFAPLVAEDR